LCTDLCTRRCGIGRDTGDAEVRHRRAAPVDRGQRGDQRPRETPSAVLIAPGDLERLEETLEIMRDAATMNRLAESDAELARGEFVSAEELAEAMRQRRAR